MQRPGDRGAPTGPSAAQGQAEVQGDYSLTKPSLPSALTSSLRAGSAPTGPAPTKPCSQERIEKVIVSVRVLSEARTEKHLQQAYTQSGVRGSGECFQVRGVFTPGSAGISPSQHSQGMAPLYPSFPSSLGRLHFRFRVAPQAPWLQQPPAHLLSGEIL